MIYMIETISIVIEVLIVFVALGIAVSRKKAYGYALALTFAIYVLFDSNRHFGWGIAQNTLDLLFLLATVSAFWAVLSIYRRK